MLPLPSFGRSLALVLQKCPPNYLPEIALSNCAAKQPAPLKKPYPANSKSSFLTKLIFVPYIVDHTQFGVGMVKGVEPR